MSLQDTIKDMFSSFGKGSPNTYVGIDIGSSYIKAVQIKKESGRLILETYGEVALGPYDDGHVAGELTHLEPDKMAAAVKNLLTEANVTAKDVVISISSATSLIFILKLPKISEREMAGVVENEARKYIPIPLSEISLDWWIIPEKEIYGEDEAENTKSRKNDIDVLVAAVRNEVVERYNEIATTLNFSSPAYEIETFSAIRASFKHELAPVMLLDFGASGLRVSIIEHGVVRKFYSVTRGSAYLTTSLQKSLNIDFLEAEKMKREVGLNMTHANQEAYNILLAGSNHIFSEVKKVLFDFEKEYHKPVNKIILTGGGSLLPQFKEQLESKYNITTVYADPFSKIVSPDFLEGVLKEAGPEFVVSIGLALQGLE